MYCKHCGNLVADDARFCSFCGTPASETPQQEEIPQQEVQPEVPVSPVYAEPETEVRSKPVFEEFQWNVNDYPDTRSVGKTEDVDFNWNADPSEIRERFAGTSGNSTAPAAEQRIPAESSTVQEAEQLSAADRIDKFYTFNRKNEEFQKLLNREYQKVKEGSAIAAEISEAEELASARFENRADPTTMDEFLEREGVVKPYEPKPFHTDVLDRIDAQEVAREMKLREEEARERALEEARREAEARKKAEEEARIQAEEEARLRAEVEARIRAEEAARENERLREEARIRAEEAARFKAEEEARIRAEEEARLRAEEEARRRAEAEAAARAEEEARRAAEEKARMQAEAEARAKAEEEARLKAEADARAAQEAEKIRVQHEARMVAKEEERIRAEEERRKAEEARLKSILKEKKKDITRKAESAVVEQEAQKVLEQTARMREAEAAKIRAAIAGIKGEAIANAERVAQSVAPDMVVAADRETVSGMSGVKAATAVTINDLFDTAEEPKAADFGTLIPKEQKMAESRSQGQPAQQATTVMAPRDGRTIEQAHQATRDRISNMARAREDYFAAFEDNKSQKPVTGRETMLNGDADLTKTRVIDKAAVLAGVEATKRISKAEMRSRDDKEFFASLDNTGLEPAPELVPKPLERKSELETAEDLLGQFEIANDVKDAEPADAEPLDAEPKVDAEPYMAAEALSEPAVEPAPEPVIEPAVEADPVDELPLSPAEIELELPEEGFAAKEEPSVEPDAAASLAVKHGLADTMVMPDRELQEEFANSFDSYGEEEAAKFREAQEAQMMSEAIPEQNAEIAANDGVFAEEYTAKAEKAISEAGEKKEKGGAGRIVLKVILIILIVIFALELVGIGIKFFAKDSAAADVIDNQLNKIIHVITGSEDTESDYIVS